ncbi:hypothetical protein [Chryseobacterium aquaticum]|uniref:hypothetical protein n=1 Tax=Chryseobacterium aquaticum TaxID=452084 RepID=UPI003F70DFC4
MIQLLLVLLGLAFGNNNGNAACNNNGNNVTTMDTGSGTGFDPGTGTDPGDDETGGPVTGNTGQTPPPRP